MHPTQLFRYLFQSREKKTWLIRCSDQTYVLKTTISGISPDKTFDGHVIPMSKQTVAEAAKACGSSLHLYRNPFESDPHDNNAEEQSTDGDGQNDLNETKLLK